MPPPPSKKHKKANTNFQYHEPAKIPTVTHRPHVQYSSQSGSMSASRSSIQTATRVVHHSGSQINANSTNVDEAAGTSIHQSQIPHANEEEIDAAYLEHVVELDDGEEDIMKRLRPKGVCVNPNYENLERWLTIVKDETLRQWQPHCDLFLAELKGLEGRGLWYSKTCSACGKQAGEYECIGCGDREMLCGRCMVETHRKNYLHRIRKWNGRYFGKAWLRDLGLRKQLGHRIGERCLNPEPCQGAFWVVDAFGMHNVAIDFCGCGNEDQNHFVQLLRVRLYPASVVNPQSAATFDALKSFEILSYESKISAFEFYYAQSRLTDNTGTQPPKDRYLPFLRMVREWRHLRMLLRAGRAHDPTGTAGTKEGECAVQCPACPLPGINMPPGWQDAPDDKKWLHAQFIALDANFRLKRKNISSHHADPGLSKGWAYFVEETAYKKHLDEYKTETEPKSSCSRHDAVTLSDAKPNRGHAASGVGKASCARHDMNLPCSVGDLQSGERYCNMDWLFHNCTVVCKSGILYFVISYDIVCQWSINLRRRMNQLDHDYFLFNGQVQVRYLVPKFHLPAHVAACRTKFSFNYSPGVGRTDGEAPERGWRKVNPLAPSTREMGPGLRRETLDSHLGDDNWQKTISIGATTKRKMMAAAVDMAEHAIEHTELSSTIPTNTLERWKTEMKEWEKDPSKPNPFEVVIEGPTQAAVRLELAEDEATQLSRGIDFSLHDQVSPSVLIASGLDIESEQRALKIEAGKLWEHAMDRQKTKLQLRTNALQRKIAAWAKIQLLYCPAVERLRGASLSEFDKLTPVDVYELPLWLPSQIKGQAVVSPELQLIEWKLRYAQAHEALDSLRHQVQIRAYLYKFKDRFVRGQGANTRARNAIAGVQARVDAAAEEYRAAYNALLALGSILLRYGWANDLLPLLPQDIRDLSEGRAGESEGRRTISWIWKSVPVDTADSQSEDYILDKLRIEWSKSHARSQRFSEEVSLLSEEMLRILRFFEVKATKWEKKANSEGWNMSRQHAEGHRAYAARQAAICTAIRSHCARLWVDIPAHVARMQSIIENPSLAKPGELDASSGLRMHSKASREEQANGRGGGEGEGAGSAA